MAEPLNLDRFRALADAYGGAIVRWPEDVREEASRLATRPDARAVLAEAATLDEGLDAWRIPAPSAALRARIADAAPVVRRSMPRRVRLWWSGVGLAAALAGAAAGSVAAQTVAPLGQGLGDSSAFGDEA